jgi:nucleoside-diphosphate-sugar epimerase
MKILISGAAGFLGRKFAQHYDNADNVVIAVDNMQSPHAKEPSLSYGWFYREDIRDFVKYQAYGRLDLFLHFAAPVGGRDKIENDPLFNADSLSIDSTVFRWAIDNVDKMVYPSSSAVYPVWLQGKYDDEWELKQDDFRVEEDTWGVPDAMYGFTKMAGEVLAYHAARYGLDTLVIRPFSGYGEGQSQEYPFPSLMRRIVNREDPVVIWGDGTQVRDFIHVDDLVNFVTNEIKKGWTGYRPVNIGSGVGTSFNELVEMATKIEGYDPEIKNLLDKPVGVHYRVSDDSVEQTVSLSQGIKRMLDYERTLRETHGSC